MYYSVTFFIVFVLASYKPLICPQAGKFSATDPLIYDITGYVVFIHQSRCQ